MKRNNAEDRLQMMIVQLLTLRGKPGLFWFHPANEGKRSLKTGSRNKAMGVVRGVPDLVLCWQGRFIGLELKATTKGRLTPEQGAVGAAISDAGGTYRVAHGYDAALGFLEMLDCIRPVRGDKRFAPRRDAA